jgi:tRNA modification GTPase
MKNSQKQIDNSIQTIVSAATPPGRGGVAIVRVSGPLVQPIAKVMLKKIPLARYATFQPFFDEDDIAIDQGLALFFPKPHSFTGEDVLEFHCHGGPAVINLLMSRVVNLGARLARPGEFSERAFLNDKLDLVQAEAIADLINATSSQAARSAMRSLQGEFSKHIHSLVEKIIHLRMFVEAAIDFAEEEIDFLADNQVSNQLQTILAELEQTTRSASQGSLLREGITIVIAGQPNVGKSSLLNALSEKEVAIVTNIPGTTRDILRENILIDGMPLHIIDTAGLRESIDLVEQEGIRRARVEISQADIVLSVIDATMDIADAEKLDLQCPVIIIRNKIDLLSEAPSIQTDHNQTIISLSAKQTLGIELLKNHIKDTVGFNQNTESTFSARRRHLDALIRAHEYLIKGQEQLNLYRAGELLAEDLRQAQQALTEITGEFSSDDLLGKIFSSFCVGK